MSTSSAQVALPSGNTGNTIIVTNTGSSDAYVVLGDSSVSATTAGVDIKAGSSMSFTVGAYTYLAAITSAGQTTLSVSLNPTTLSISNVATIFADSDNYSNLSADVAPVYTAQGKQKGYTGQTLTDYVQSQTAQFFNLLTIFGPNGSYAPGKTNLYDAGHSTVSTSNDTVQLNTPSSFNYSYTTFNPNFVYLLSNSEIANVEAGVHAWTTSQLDNGINFGVLQTSPSGGSTETPVITGANITLKVGINSGGNIGSLVDPTTIYNASQPNPIPNDPTSVTIGYEPNANIDGTPIQQALATAAQSDLNFLAALPDEVTVNFSGNSMTITGGSWTASNYEVGDWLYIGGLTKNATSNGAYLQIASISTDGKTITFSTPVASEIDETILVAPVVATETVDSTLAATVSVNFSGSSMTRIDGQSWSGTSYAVGGLVYIGGATKNATTNGQYLEIASISGATITFTTPVTSAPNQTATVAPVNYSMSAEDESTLGTLSGTATPTPSNCSSATRAAPEPSRW